MLFPVCFVAGRTVGNEAKLVDLCRNISYDSQSKPSFEEGMEP